MPLANLNLPAPFLYKLSQDDLVWSVRVDLNQLTGLFQDIADWMDQLTQSAINAGGIQAGESLAVAQHYTIRMKPVDPQSAIQFNQGVGGPWPDMQKLTALIEAHHFELATVVAQPMVTVTGINGTGFVSIDSSIVTTAAGLAVSQTWQSYWDEWLASDLTLSIRDDDGRAFGHTELSPAGSAATGDRLAAFMLVASRSLAHFNAFITRAPKNLVVHASSAGRRNQIIGLAPKFERVTITQLASTTFVLAGEIGTTDAACEVDRGTWNPMTNTASYGDPTIKLYKTSTVVDLTPSLF